MNTYYVYCIKADGRSRDKKIRARSEREAAALYYSDLKERNAHQGAQELCVAENPRPRSGRVVIRYFCTDTGIRGSFPGMDWCECEESRSPETAWGALSRHSPSCPRQSRKTLLANASRIAASLLNMLERNRVRIDAQYGATVHSLLLIATPALSTNEKEKFKEYIREFSL